MTDFTRLPPDLPVPVDDGAADGVAGKPLPDLALAATDGSPVNLADPVPGLSVIYAYPRTGPASGESPPGWDDIPGARGCTPESCGFRDHLGDLKAVGVSRVFGLSSQDTGYQREAATRLRLPFPILSDEELLLAGSLGLPTFEAGGMTLYKRLTMVIEGGVISHVFYPVFPPDRHAREVLDWVARP